MIVLTVAQFPGRFSPADSQNTEQLNPISLQIVLAADSVKLSSQTVPASWGSKGYYGF